MVRDTFMGNPMDEAFAFIQNNRGTPLGGSTGARRFDTEQGSFVGKRGAHPQHILNEFDMNQYLNELGVPVPEAQLQNIQGQPTMLTRFEEDALPMNVSRDRQQLTQDFVPHATISNWDMLGMHNDNALRRPTGELSYVDVGGAGPFRAQGAPKGSAFGTSVGELDTLREKNPRALGHITEQDLGRSFDTYGGEDAMTQALNAIRNPDTRNIMQQRIQDVAQRVA